MLEIINRLEARKHQSLDEFFTYFGMYEDVRRTRALRGLLGRHRSLIRGRTCVEAGAGLGGMTQTLLKLGARRVYAVEANPSACVYLRARFKDNRRVEVVHSAIERFRPRVPVDFLFQELYGPLLLEESLAALDRLRFKPAAVVPNEGQLLAEFVPMKRLSDPLIDAKVLKLIEGALVTDLVPGFRFRRPRPVLRWKFGSRTPHRVTLAKGAPGEMLVFGIEIRHNGRRVCGTSDCSNWPYVFTPATRRRTLSFAYRGGWSEVLLGHLSKNTQRRPAAASEIEALVKKAAREPNNCQRRPKMRLAAKAPTPVKR